MGIGVWLLIAWLVVLPTAVVLLNGDMPAIKRLVVLPLAIGAWIAASAAATAPAIVGREVGGVAGTVGASAVYIVTFVAACLGFSRR